MTLNSEAGLVAALLVIGVPMIAAWRDLRRWPTEVWQASPHHRILWALLIVVLPVLGPVLYARRVRPTLRAAR